MEKVIGRLSGGSDILYIGASENKEGLKRRLQQYFNPGPTQRTNRRIKELSAKYDMEVAWHVCNSPENCERELLKRYLKDMMNCRHLIEIRLLKVSYKAIKLKR
jgi:hypothetical protein